MNWPIFTEIDSCTRFWESQSISQQEPIITTTLHKMVHTNIVSRIHSLSSQGILSYEKKNKQWKCVQMNVQISVKLIELKIKEQDAVKVIRIRRNPQVFVYLWNSDQQQFPLFSTVTFTFFKRLAAFCICQNFEQLYTIQDLVGKGGFSKVYQLTPVNKQPFQMSQYAGKVYSKNELTQKKGINSALVRTECEILRKLNSPFIMTLFEIIQLDEVLILITELLRGGSLYQLLKEKSRIQENEASGIVFRIALGLQTLHSLGYVHRDIKLENVLMDKDDVKIIDFGFAEPINREELTSGQGTVGYMAPEIFSGLPYTEIGDVFSLGVIYYALLTGKAPFRCNNQEGLLRANKLAEIDFSEYRFVNVSQKIIALVKGMLNRNPKQRTPLNDVIQNLRSSNILTINFSQSFDGSQTLKKNGVQSLYQVSQASLSSLKKKQRMSHQMQALDNNKYIIKTSSFRPSLINLDNFSDETGGEEAALPKFVCEFLGMAMTVMNGKKFP